MYNENDEQLFIKIVPNEEPIEFLLTQQPLTMIRSGFISKNEIRETIETGLQLESAYYYKTFERRELGLAVTLKIHIDDVLRVIETVEAQIF